jgi:amino acid adenylation domain-containing protein
MISHLMIFKMDVLAKDPIGKEVKSKAEKMFWENALAGMPVSAGFPSLPDAEELNEQSREAEFFVDGEIWTALRKITGDVDPAIYTYLLTALKFLLYRYSGVSNPPVGAPVFKAEYEEGLINSILVFTGGVDTGKSFKENLVAFKTEVLAAGKAQNYPVSKALQDAFGNENIKTFLVYGNLQHARYIDNSERDITFVFSKEKEGLKGAIVYKAGKYGSGYMATLSRHFLNVLRNTVSDINIPLSKLDILDAGDKERLIYGFNNTKVPFADGKTLSGLLTEQVGKNPDATALVFGEERITYGTLDQQSDILAAYLHETVGLKSDEPVCLLMERGISMVVALFGVMKAGAAYVPMDPDYPDDRISFILKDCGARIALVSSAALAARIKSLSGIPVTDLSAGISSSGNKPEITVSASGLAYIIYTSGSTGMPKGAMLEHRGVVNRIEWMKKQYDFGENDVVLQKTPYVFDVSVWEFFMTLCYGATLVLCSKETIYDPARLLEVIGRYGVTTLHFVPSMLNTFLAGISENNRHLTRSVRQVFASGEALSPSTVKKFHRTLQAKLHNLYGPTEASVDVSFYQTGKNDEIVPIGKPISNIRLYVLDRQMQPVPEGVAGELCISGVGVARGYLNRPDLSREKFMEDPFLPGERLYKTGDLARWLPGGNIEYLGRIDNQVKIRGYRIELGEIETRLLEHEDIREAVVVAKEEPSTQTRYLCAYYVSSSEIPFSDLSAFLSVSLPEYMIPSYFVRLDDIPLTTNGKVDRRALPEPGKRVLTGAGYEAPSSEEEKRMARLWEEVLNVENISVNDSFFQLGGHSLKAGILISRIHKEFRVDVPLRQIFKTPSVRDLTRFVLEEGDSSLPGIEPAPVQELYPVTSSQKRMFILQRLEDPTGYNMPGAWLIEGKADPEKFRWIAGQLIRKHESFRTHFVLQEEDLFQKIEDEVEFELEYFEGSLEKAGQYIKDFVRAFDLTRAPLMRLTLVKCAEDRHILMFDMHHIISDGTSIGILIKDFDSLIKGKPLTVPKIQYKDFAVWQNNFFRSKAFEKQKSYWLRQLKDLPVLDISTDFPIPAVRTVEGKTIVFHLGREQSNGLRKLAAKNNSTLFMVLLASYNVLLSKYSGQEDIVVGTAVAGRQHAEIQDITGMFVNTLALRNRPKADLTFIGFLEDLKENVLSAFENPDYPFEELVDNLEIDRNTSHNPAVDTMMLLQNMEQGALGTDDLRFTPVEYTNDISRLFLSLEIFEKPDDIRINWAYSTQLFRAETAERMIRHFRNIIDEVVRDPQRKLSEISMLDAEEESRLLAALKPSGIPFENLTVSGLFEKQSALYPGKVALIAAGKEYTYASLNESANRLGTYLRTRLKIKPGDRIGVLMDRSPEMLLALLGIIRSSAAYVPLDPAYPLQRINSISRDAGLKAIIANVSMEGLETQVLSWEKTEAELRDLPCVSPENLSGPEDLLYVLYTSGSTGAPKGVKVKNSNMAAFMLNFGTIFPVSPSDTILAVTNLTFDIAGLELLCSLCSGLTVVLAGEDDVSSPVRLSELIGRYGINVLQFTPSRLQLMLEAAGDSFLSGVKTLLVGGEAMPETLFERLKDSQAENIFNVYGPTETTIWSTALDIRKSKDLTIGKPLLNEQVYILSRNLEICPVGVWGEICIGGTGVSAGYMNRPELDSEKYIAHPLLEGRIYRTGDRGRLLSDGCIEFGGRSDEQVKLRGFRIELGEIESVLIRYPGIEDAVVALKGAEGEEELVAYYISGSDPDADALERSLRDFLPGYMIPAYFIRLDKMPLSANGKIDRKELPLPARAAAPAKLSLPRNETDAQLLEIWKELLHKEQIGINDNFFLLGGNSLKSILMLSRVNEQLGREVPLLHFFRFPTVMELTDYILSDQMNVAETDYIRLGGSSDKSLFLFPPGLGYSVAYKEMAQELKDWSVYGFNFIESSDRMERYVQHILNISPEGPYILMGYSAGGNLAFHVAKELERKGHEVSALILIDSYRRLEAVSYSQQELEEEVGRYYMGNAELPEYLQRLKDRARRKTTAYLSYLAMQAEKEPLRTDIHLVVSETPSSENTDAYLSREAWKDLAEGGFFIHKGSGKHMEMFGTGHLKVNTGTIAALIKAGAGR